MWLRRSKTREESFRFPGRKHALDGHGAVYTVETMACESVLIRAVPELAEITGPMRHLAPSGYEQVSDQPVSARYVEHLRPLLSQLAGQAQAGLRAAGITSSMGSATEALSSSSGKHLTYIINLTCRALQRQSGAIHGSHDDYYRVADAGCFQMFAKNAQETADLTLIAHRIAELALTPGIVAQDYYRTTHSVQTVRLPERGLVARFLGWPEDNIQTPTPAQRILFGEERRRIPVLVDRDRPTGIGGAQDDDTYFRGVAAQRPFFADHLDELVDRAMGEFAKLTGRVYQKASGHRTEDADFVVVAQGAVVEELEAVVDYLREQDGMKAGVVTLRMFRPFPGPELTRMLKGKKAVTVLERTDQPLAEDLPMTKEIRSAVAKAVENGTGGETETSYPAYDRYTTAADRPRVFSGAYGVGGRIPSFAELCAVYRNMTPQGSGKRFFYAGAVFLPPDRRFPHLESLHQRMEKEYPRLADLAVSGGGDTRPVERRVAAFQLCSLSVQGGLFAGNLFAQTLANALDWTVRTYPDGGIEPSIQPVDFTVACAAADETLKSKPDLVDAVLVSGDRLVETLSSKTRIKKGGILIVETTRDPAGLWRSFSPRTIRWIEESNVEMYTVDARKIASETSSRPSFVDQLAVWALFGAHIKTAKLLSADDLQKLLDRLSERLTQLFGPAHYLVEDITKCFVGGMDGVAGLDWQRLSREPRTTPPETEAPWTVQQVSRHDGTVFDVNRFWHSVGYLYNTGEPAKTLTDPYLATGIVPGGSSAFRDMTPYRLRTPRWLPASCQACGLCWSTCPDSALPPAAQTLPAILEAAVRHCEAGGRTFVHLPRVAEHLAKQAYNLFLRDDASRYQTLGPLLGDAFSRIAEKMGSDGEKRRVLETEFEHARHVVEHYPVAKTERFFEKPQREEKGSGRFLSIAHNPLSCTGCGLCVEVCPNDAYEWTEQTPHAFGIGRKTWEFQMKLPDLRGEELERFLSPSDPKTDVYRLLDKTAYHSMVGGDTAFPGNSVKTAIHLVTAAVESVMHPRHRAHIDRLDHLIEQLEKRIQGRVSRVLEINDFERFGEQLTRLRREGVTAETLARAISEDGGLVDIDPDQLARLTGLLSRIKEQRALYAHGGTGAGRARMVITIDPGSATFWSGAYPYNPLRQPWVSQLPGDAPALAEGIYDGITRRMVEEFKTCRQAELEASDSYDPRDHDEFFENFHSSDLTDDERNLIPPVIVIAHTGTTSAEDLTPFLSGGRPIRIVLLNTEGISVRDDDSDGGPAQTSGPSGVQTAGDLGFLLSSRPDAFVLQTTVGHPGHLIRGVAEALGQRRPALFHVYAPDPLVAGIAPEKSAEHARSAYASRGFPLFTVNPERDGGRPTLEGNPDPGQAWTTHETPVREPSGIESSITTPFTVADWAFTEGRYQRHFEVVPKGQLNDQMKLLADYLDLEASRRGDYDPYINVVDNEQRHFLAIVSPAMARATEERKTFWMRLRATAAAPTPEMSGAGKARREEPEVPAALDDSTRERLTETLLRLAGFERDPDFFNQTLGQFVQRNKHANPDGQANDD